MFVVEKIDTVLKKITYDFFEDDEKQIFSDFQCSIENDKVILKYKKNHISTDLLIDLMEKCGVDSYYKSLYTKCLRDCENTTNHHVFYKHWCRATLDISFSYLYTKVEEQCKIESLKGKKLEKETEKRLLEIYEKFLRNEDKWFTLE
jgi:hypothetical protein